MIKVLFICHGEIQADPQKQETCQIPADDPRSHIHGHGFHSALLCLRQLHAFPSHGVPPLCCFIVAIQHYYLWNRNLYVLYITQYWKIVNSIFIYSPNFY